MQVNHLDIDALVNIKTPSEVQISPDGRYIAFGWGDSSKPDKYTPRSNAIYVVDTNTRALRRLNDNENVTNESPCWSPDGQSLAFVSNREQPDEFQLWLQDLNSGEAQACTNLRGNV